MYTLTVKISDRGTILHEGGTSAAGHMWYSLSDGNETASYGFAPKEHNVTSGPGTVGSFPRCAWECIVILLE